MERLEAISKVTHVDIEVLKKAKMYTHSDFPKVSEEEKGLARWLIRFLVDYVQGA